VQAAALGAERIVLAGVPKGLDRLRGRPARVRTFRMRASRALYSAA